MTAAPLRRLALSALLALSVTACGSTVVVGAPGSALPAPGAGEQGLGGPDAVPVPTASSGAPGAFVPAPGGGPVPGDVGGGPAPVGGGPTAPAPGGARPPAARGVDGPGVTATTVKIGVPYTTDSEQGNSALGADGAGGSDQRRYAEAVFADLNRRGGLAGRKVVGSFVEIRTTSGETIDSQLQAACEHWTRDDRVFAVIDASREVLRSCLQSRGVLPLNTGATSAVARTFARYPHLLEISSIALDRYAGATADGLAAGGYFSSSAVVGVVTWDEPSFRTAVDDSLVPALRRLGHPAKERAYIKVADTLGGVSDTSAAVSSAVLRFRQQGVTHVILVDGPAGVFSVAGLSFLFIRSASSQQYYPRYGMNDGSSPQSAMDAGLWSPDDVRGSQAVTWDNSLDASDAGIRRNAARVQCLDLMKRAGMVPSSVNARMIMLRTCDYGFFLGAALGTYRGALDRDVVLARVSALGTSHRSPIAYLTRFSRTQRDGVAGLRRQALDDGCGCYRYTSGVYAAPGR